jgi:hypothetical protein
MTWYNGFWFYYDEIEEMARELNITYDQLFECLKKRGLTP